MRRTCRCFDSTRTRCTVPVSDTVRVDAMQCWYLHGSSLLYRLQLIHANSTGHINYDNWWQLDEHVKSMHNACCYCLASIHIQGMPNKNSSLSPFWALLFVFLIWFCFVYVRCQSHAQMRGEDFAYQHFTSGMHRYQPLKYTENNNISSLSRFQYTIKHSELAQYSLTYPFQPTGSRPAACANYVLHIRMWLHL